MIPDRLVRTLAAVLTEHHLTGRCTVRSVAERRGLSVSTVHGHLVALWDLGLVGYEPGRCGVLRPLVRRVA